MKKVIVASFQRSGTHFLINNLITNFEGFELGWVDVFNSRLRQAAAEAKTVDFRERIWDQLRTYYPLPKRQCVKTHYQMYFFEPWLEAILEMYDIIYVVRDPRDTMVACYHYYNQTSYEPFVKEPVFSKFLRAELGKVETETDPYSYSLVKPRNIVDKWHKHVLSWLPYQDKGVLFVKFSDLKFNLQETLRRIEKKTSQRLKPVIQEVLLNDSRVRPDFKLEGIRRGEVGVWRDYFSDDDQKFLSQTLSEPVRQFFDK